MRWMRKIEAELYGFLPIQDITLLIRNGEVIVKRGQAPALPQYLGGLYVIMPCFKRAVQADTQLK